jgi:hypothetical protein
MLAWALAVLVIAGVEAGRGRRIAIWIRRSKKTSRTRNITNRLDGSISPSVLGTAHAPPRTISVGFRLQFHMIRDG